MSRQYQEEPDSKPLAKSRQAMNEFLGDNGSRKMFSPNLSPKNILSLQRTLGNHAVLGLLSQQPKGTIQRTPDAPKKLKTPPSWARVSSNNPLPGEHVKGITDRQATFMQQDAEGHPIYTEQDREKLKNALMARHQENTQNGPDFAANYAGSLLEIWTGYVTEDMAEAADDASWSMLSKLALFALKEVMLNYLFPPAALSKLAAEVVSAFNGTRVGLAAAADLSQDAIENGLANSEVQKRGGELRQMTSGLSASLQQVILSAFEEIGSSFYYQDWLDNAPLQDLHLFRLPPVIPAVPKDKIEFTLAQALTGLIHDQDDVRIDRHRESMMFGLLGYMDYNFVKNGLLINASVDEHGIERIPEPILDVPKVLRGKLEGHTIGEVPQIPLLIELRCAEPKRIYSPDELNAIEELEEVWPNSSPLQIKRYPDGDLEVRPGSMKEMFYLYSLVNPLADLGAFALSQRRSKAGVSDVPLSPKEAAHHLYYELYSMMDGGAQAYYTRISHLEIPKVKLP